MSKGFNPISVANKFIQLGKEQDIAEMNTIKLNKLVYLAESLHRSVFEEPLINDEIKAHKNGPVPRKVQEEFKGSQSIKKESSLSKRRIASNQYYALAVINYVQKNFGKKSPTQLEKLTHKRGCAWFKAFKVRGEKQMNMDESVQDWQQKKYKNEDWLSIYDSVLYELGEIPCDKKNLTPSQALSS